MYSVKNKGKELTEEPATVQLMGKLKNRPAAGNLKEKGSSHSFSNCTCSICAVWCSSVTGTHLPFVISSILTASKKNRGCCIQAFYLQNGKQTNWHLQGVSLLSLVCTGQKLKLIHNDIVSLNSVTKCSTLFNVKKIHSTLLWENLHGENPNYRTQGTASVLQLTHSPLFSLEFRKLYCHLKSEKCISEASPHPSNYPCLPDTSSLN